MQATNDLRALLNAAEQAAARDDAAAAERLLREALALQESTAGSPREEIARTLNNLAVVCEMTGKMADAETCYRRAHAIATATLPPSDPFVTTSRENLEQFCSSQGIPLERPAAVAARGSVAGSVRARACARGSHAVSTRSGGATARRGAACGVTGRGRCLSTDYGSGRCLSTDHGSGANPSRHARRRRTGGRSAAFDRRQRHHSHCARRRDRRCALLVCLGRITGARGTSARSTCRAVRARAARGDTRA